MQRLIAAALFALFAYVTPLCAQTGPLRATGQATLAVTTSTANVALPNGAATVLLTNNGASDLRFALGSSTVTASATTSFLLKAGTSATYAANNAAFIAAIGIGGSTSLEVTQGNGQPALGGGSSSGGGGGGAVTNAGTFAVQNTAATPAGTALIGKVGIDQTTPGTTNLVALGANQSVNVAQFGGVSTSTGQVAVSTTPVTATNTAMVVDLRPDSPGIVALGQTTKSASVPVTTASDQLGGATVAASFPHVLTSQYPVNSVTTSPAPITASATGTTAATTATLAAVSGKTTYLCGFSIRANATAAATGNATVTGTITGTLNFTQWTAPLASGIGITEPSIGSVCISASTTNTAIAVISAAPGSGGVVSVSAWGYQL